MKCVTVLAERVYFASIVLLIDVVIFEMSSGFSTLRLSSRLRCCRRLIHLISSSSFSSICMSLWIDVRWILGFSKTNRFSASSYARNGTTKKRAKNQYKLVLQLKYLPLVPQINHIPENSFVCFAQSEQLERLHQSLADSQLCQFQYDLVDLFGYVER